MKSTTDLHFAFNARYLNAAKSSGCLLRRNEFKLYISQTVLDEVAKGDVDIAAQRLEILRNLPLLEYRYLLPTICTPYEPMEN